MIVLHTELHQFGKPQTTSHIFPINKVIMSNLMNKAKDMLHKDKSSKQDDTYGDDSSYGNQGVGNDSGYGNTGSSNLGGGYNTQDDPRSTNAGPHSSNLANKTDPRVDSDRDSELTTLVWNQMTSC